MRFDKDMLFLGAVAQKLTSGDLAGRTMYNVQLFDRESNGPVGVNVMDKQPELEDQINSRTFGDMCMCTFDLRPDNGKFKIRLVQLLPMR